MEPTCVTVVTYAYVIIDDIVIQGRRGVCVCGGEGGGGLQLPPLNFEGGEGVESPLILRIFFN